MDMNHFKLQFITHFTDTYSYLDSARMALEGGCRWVQLRMKHASDEETEAVALEVQKLCRTYGATFLIDDRVELVRKLKADGVHLGKNDMPIAEARKILGKDFLIGGTANTFDDVRAHYEAGADYIGCGPFRFTTTKEKLSPILGLEGYRSIVQQMKAEGIHLPIVAIGGITLEDIPAIMQTGVTGIALSGTILRTANPVEETKKIVNQLKMKNEEFVDVFIFRQKNKRNIFFKSSYFQNFITNSNFTTKNNGQKNHKKNEVPKRFCPKAKKGAKTPHSDFTKGEERQPPKNPVLSFGPKSGEAEHGEKKRRLFEQSEFLRFRRAKLRSRSETADGGFSFCYLFLFAAKKKK